MFSQKELNIDSRYFEIIGTSIFCVTIRRRNTGHYWHIVNADGTNYRSCQIYHKHNPNTSYHLHGHNRALSKCIQDIKDHDIFQINGRKQTTKKNGIVRHVYMMNYTYSYVDFFSVTSHSSIVLLFPYHSNSTTSPDSWLSLIFE